jgi:tRNA (guanine37-N1)-methyltransferase
MRIQVITIFPELFHGFLDTSLVRRAIEHRMFTVAVHNLRSFASGRHQTVDDEPYGGGGGMVMQAPAWIRAVREVSGEDNPHRVLLSPQGTPFSDAKAQDLSRRDHLVMLCGRYEGIDERVRQTVVDEEISIGDYVLSGGELPAMVVIEALSRQIPGVVGSPDSVAQDSFRNGLLDFPHYTRPREVEGHEVPEVLISGDHEAIRVWRLRQSLLATLEKRPDLLEKVELSVEQRRLLDELLMDSVSPGVKQ